MVGCELASNVDYLLARASSELAVPNRLQPLAKRLAPIFIRIFGVPEIGLHLRTRAVLQALPQNVGRFCDLGCGAGFLLGAIARSKKYTTITGVEIEDVGASLAKKLHPAALVLYSDVLDIPSEYDSRFDTAASVDVLEHLTYPNVIAFLERARALLVPGGLLTVHVPMPNQRRHFRSFDDWSHHDHEREGFTVEEMINAFGASGFEVTEIAKTAGYFGSLAWELNIKLAATFAQAVLFPPLLAIALLDDIVKSRRYNGLLITAKKAA